MINTESFVLYESTFKDIERKAKQFGKDFAYNYFNAICQFGLYGLIPDEDDPIWGYGFEQSITSISSAKDRRKKNIEDGSRGGRPVVELDKEEVMQKKQELKTWKAVAAYFNVSEDTLRKLRKQWEAEESEKTGKTEKPKNPKNLSAENVGKTEKPKNLNVNVNENENFNENFNDNTETEVSVGGLTSWEIAQIEEIMSKQSTIPCKIGRW